MITLYYCAEENWNNGQRPKRYTMKDPQTYRELELLVFDSGEIMVKAATYSKEKTYPLGKPCDPEEYMAVWKRFLEFWPQLSDVQLCPCGCGEAVKPGRMYADPKRCKVRACRWKARSEALSNREVAHADFTPPEGVGGLNLMSVGYLPAEVTGKTLEAEHNTYINKLVKRIDRVLKRGTAGGGSRESEYGSIKKAVSNFGVTPSFDEDFAEAYQLFVDRGIDRMSERLTKALKPEPEPVTSTIPDPIELPAVEYNLKSAIKKEDEFLLMSVLRCLYVDKPLGPKRLAQLVDTYNNKGHDLTFKEALIRLENLRLASKVMGGYILTGSGLTCRQKGWAPGCFNYPRENQ